MNKAFTFIEVTISLVILAAVIVGFFQSFDIAINANYRASQQLIATNVARALMAEIMAKDFTDPDEDTTVLGPEINEDRLGISGDPFDDVDDYHVYMDNPTNLEGVALLGGVDASLNPLPNYGNFYREVTLNWVDSNMNPVAAITDYKRIRVEVTGPSVKPVVLMEVKTR